MKKLFILCALMFTTSSFASGIDANATSAPCDNATLETYGGTANVEINWEPNTIQTRWYNGNKLIDTTNTNAGSCVYDDVLNRPTNPTRTGYTFMGWTLRPEYDFSTFTVKIGKESRGKGKDGSCWRGRVGIDAGSGKTTCDEGFDDLEPGEWKDFFDYGTIYGMTMCSSTVGTTRGEIGTPVETTNGTYCWCKVTGYIPAESNVKYAPSNVLPWVYVNQLSVCERGCADWCAWVFVHYGSMQNPGFGK